MPVPDFSPGEVLTAAAMDSIGLWLVKSQTVGTGVTSIPVTNAFSAQFDNYRIIYSGGVSAGAVGLALSLTGSGANNYYSAQAYTFYASDGVAGYLRDNNTSSWTAAGGGYVDGNVLDVELYNPFLTLRTAIASIGRPDIRTNGATYYGLSGFHNLSASYTGFTITASAGLTGGTIRVYGYRK
jgi:hypothetical protein